MRELVVSDAPQAYVARVVKDLVEESGGVVSHHTHRFTEFDHLRATDDAWSRSGYVGTYKRFGEDAVRMRIRVWASWPRRLFLWSVYLGLIEAGIFFALSVVGAPPPPNVWIVTALATFAAIGGTLLAYASSWAESADIEEDLARQIGSTLRDDDEVPGDIYTKGDWMDHRQDLVEAAIAEAKQDHPSRGQRALQTVRATIGGGDEPDEPDEPAEPVAPEPEAPEQPAEAEDDEEDEDPEEDGSVVDRVAFWRSPGETDVEDEAEDRETTEEPAEAVDESEDADEDERSLVDRVAFWRSEGGPDEAQASPEPEDTEAAEEDATDEGEASDEEGVLDRLAFWRSGDEEPEPSDEDGDEDGSRRA